VGEGRNASKISGRREKMNKKVREEGEDLRGRWELDPKNCWEIGEEVRK